MNTSGCRVIVSMPPKPSDTLSRGTRSFANPCVELIDLSVVMDGVLFVYWKGLFNMNKPHGREAALACIELVKEGGHRFMISNHDEMEGSTQDYLD